MSKFLEHIEKEINIIKKLESQATTNEFRKLYTERLAKLMEIRIDYLIEKYTNSLPNIPKSEICKHPDSWREISSKQLPNGSYEIVYRCIRCNLTTKRIFKKKTVEITH